MNCYSTSPHPIGIILSVVEKGSLVQVYRMGRDTLPLLVFIFRFYWILDTNLIN